MIECLFLPPTNNTSPGFVPGQLRRLGDCSSVEMVLVVVVVLAVVVVEIVVVVVVDVVALTVVQVFKKQPVRSWLTFELTVRVRVRLMNNVIFNFQIRDLSSSTGPCLRPVRVVQSHVKLTVQLRMSYCIDSTRTTRDTQNMNATHPRLMRNDAAVWLTDHTGYCISTTRSNGPQLDSY